MKTMDSVAADVNRPGTAADRKTSTITALSTGAAAGVTIGLADWFFLECFSTGHFHWISPSKALIEVASPILILPLGLWLGRVLSLIGTIITNRLQRDAGTTE